MHRFLFVVSFASVFLACSSGGGPSEAQRMQASVAAASAVSLQQAFTVTDAIVAFDPTLDGGRDAMTNAMNVEMQATTSLSGCGTVTRTGTTIMVAFGPAPGCTLPSGVTVSGTVSVDVSIVMGVHANLTFVGVVVDGKHLDGTLNMVAMLDTGTALGIDGDLTTDEGHFVGHANIHAVTGSFMLDAALTQTPTGGTAQSFAITALHMNANACYPDAGTVAVTNTGVTTTLTFDASTPATGVVAASIGPIMFTTMLPAYGTCPHS